MLTNLRLLESMLTVHRRVNKNTERCYEDMTVNGQNKLCPSFLLVYLKLNKEKIEKVTFHYQNWFMKCIIYLVLR